MPKVRKHAPVYLPTRPEGQNGSPARARAKAARKADRVAKHAEVVAAMKAVAGE